MALERIDVSGPKLPEGSQPGIELLKWLGPQPVDTTLRVHGGLDETGIAQHAKMLGHGWLRHIELTLDLSHGLFGRDQKA
jgi:hypothetical protein